MNAEPSSVASPPSLSRGQDFPFFIGVTGIMKLYPACIESARERIREILRWVRGGPEVTLAGKPGLELKRTPLILLSGMAPGADQLVAKVAEDEGIRVEVPLPFPRAVMDIATSYDPKLTPKGWPAGTTPWEGSACIDRHRSYLVRLAGDDEGRPSEEEFRAMATGNAQRNERYRRYRAVGEFIAANSDLLIALPESGAVPPDPDQPVDLTECGTPAIVQAKRRGLSGGLLCLPTTLDWADNGPALVIGVRRFQDNASAGISGAGVDVDPVQVLHPFDCRLDDGDLTVLHHGEAHDADAEGWRRLQSFVTSLERLNAAAAPLSPDAVAAARDKSLSSRLPRKRPAAFFRPDQDPDGVKQAAVADLPDPVAPDDPRAVQLADMAVARDRVAGANRRLDAEVKEFKQRMVGYAIGFGVLVTLGEHWVVEMGGGQASGGHHAIRCLAAGLAVPLLFYALYALRRYEGKLWSWLTNSPSVFARLEDFRAIAEGLRVQFYWTAGGVGESVPANYLQRARGDLNWIRAAISGHGFPYEADRSAFLRLEPERQETLLRSILWGWLEEQRDYFRKRVDEFSRWKAESHFASVFLLSAGLVATFWPLLVHLTQDEGAIRWLGPIPGLALAMAGLLAVLVGRTWIRSLIAQWDLGREKGVGLPADERRRIATLYRWAECLSLPITLGFLFGVGMVAFLYSAPSGSGWPAGDRWVSLFKGFSLLGASMYHLSAGWKFLTENIHRYSAMAVLVGRACIRLEETLKLLHGSQGPARARLLAETHAILASVGKDALDEKTDWYVLHRTHPMEPIGPG